MCPLVREQSGIYMQTWATLHMRSQDRQTPGHGLQASRGRHDNTLSPHRTETCTGSDKRHSMKYKVLQSLRVNMQGRFFRPLLMASWTLTVIYTDKLWSYTWTGRGWGDTIYGVSLMSSARNLRHSWALCVSKICKRDVSMYSFAAALCCHNNAKNFSLLSHTPSTGEKSQS